MHPNTIYQYHSGDCTVPSREVEVHLFRWGPNFSEGVQLLQLLSEILVPGVHIFRKISSGGSGFGGVHFCRDRPSPLNPLPSTLSSPGSTPLATPPATSPSTFPSPVPSSSARDTIHAPLPPARTRLAQVSDLALPALTSAPGRSHLCMGYTRR